MVNTGSLPRVDRTVNRGLMPGQRLPERERREEILAGAFRVAVRDKIRGLTVSAVAKEAGVSKGLVFFHFDDKEGLLLALLDWVLEIGPKVEVPASLEENGRSHPARRLTTLLHHQVALLPGRRERVELFLDFWVMGTALPEAQRRIREAFDRYRAEFLPFTRPVVESLPGRFGGDGAEGLAAVIVSFIQGCALQLIADPDRFDVDRYMRAVEGLVLREYGGLSG